VIPLAEAVKLARELLEAVRELTAELRAHRPSSSTRGNYER
jgi:hypothetical protein